MFSTGISLSFAVSLMKQTLLKMRLTGAISSFFALLSARIAPCFREFLTGSQEHQKWFPIWDQQRAAFPRYRKTTLHAGGMWQHILWPVLNIQARLLL